MKVPFKTIIKLSTVDQVVNNGGHISENLDYYVGTYMRLHGGDFSSFCRQHGYDAVWEMFYPFKLPL